MQIVNKKMLQIGGIGLAALLVIAALYFSLFVKQSGGYSVVHLSTGEVYIGRLSTFPRLTLADGHLFQAVQDPADARKSTFQLIPLKDALWAPQYLYLNPDHVLFSGPLAESSNILQTLQNPSSNPPVPIPASATTTEE
jgi:hypothetical protein